MEALNKETQVVLDILKNKMSPKQFLKDYFWLREEIIYDNDGINIQEVINEFRDLEALTIKKVEYKEHFKEMWLTEEIFYNLFPNGIRRESNNWNTPKVKTK